MPLIMYSKIIITNTHNLWTKNVSGFLTRLEIPETANRVSIWWLDEHFTKKKENKPIIKGCTTFLHNCLKSK